jgi:hypothetical protein
VATGWDLRNAQTVRANNFGFVSERDFVADPQAVAVIGDSFVEASMLEPAHRPAEQLADALSRSRPVYGMGVPGSALLDDAERICMAAKRLDVRDYVVVLEASDVRQSLCGSGNIHGPCLDRQTLAPSTELHPAPTPLKRLVRHSALAQYVFSQLKLDARRLLDNAFVRAVPQEPPAPPQAAPVAGAADAQGPTPAQLQQVQALAQAFLARAEPCVRGRMVLVVDGRRERDAPAVERPLVREIRAERRAFIELLRARNSPHMIVIDADPVYREHTTRSPLSIVVGPYDEHLNRIGVNLLMSAAARALQGDAQARGP